MKAFPSEIQKAWLVYKAIWDEEDVKYQRLNKYCLYQLR